MTTATKDYEQLAALVALLFHGDRRYKPSQLRPLFEADLTPLDILRHGDGSALVPEDRSDLLALAASDLERWQAAGISLLSPFAEKYPAQLAAVFDYPVLLFAKGRVADDERSAALVGSRGVSDAGLRFTDRTARLLVDDGVTVVSGLARGVDGSAHAAALDAGGRTVAVLGNGINRVYPAEHRDLQEQIASSGLLISQFLPDASPTRQSFPQRNIVMSAYSSVTVIVEAAEKSGTRIQADAAVKHGRPLVLTSQVVENTTWGRKYADGGYNVEVASSPDGVKLAVSALLARSHTPAPSAM